MVELKAFAGLTAPSREALERGAQARRFAKGDDVVAKGDRVSGAYLVLDGELQVYALSPHGQETALYLLRPGETCVLALNCLFNDLPYPAWVDARADSLVAVVPGVLYRKLFQNDPAIQDLTVRALSSAVFRLMTAIEEVSRVPLERQLAGFLVDRAGPGAVVAMTQQEIAAYLGASREAVARLMATFADRGWLASARGRITLRDRGELSRLASATVAPTRKRPREGA